MKALITGAGGFIGSHIADAMLSNEIDVCGLLHVKERKSNVKHIENKISLRVCDITNKQKLEKIVAEEKPDYIFHMAAQSFVMPSWQDPVGTFDTNINGTLYLLDAVRKAKIDPIIAVACSSAAYGLNYPNEIPIKETKEFRPSSPYAVSKAATDHLSFLYWRAYGMKILRIRFFNTIGPRKIGSAVADWTKGIAEIEKGKKKELGVGNLESTVDFTDVRDSVNAVWMLTKKGKWGDAYNICTGKGNNMKDILDRLTEMSTSKIKIVTDPKKIRPSDDPIFVGDNSKIKGIGWKQKINIGKTLRDTLDFWRSSV